MLRGACPFRSGGAMDSCFPPGHHSWQYQAVKSPGTKQVKLTHPTSTTLRSTLLVVFVEQSISVKGNSCSSFHITHDFTHPAGIYLLYCIIYVIQFIWSIRGSFLSDSIRGVFSVDYFFMKSDFRLKQFSV